MGATSYSAAVGKARAAAKSQPAGADVHTEGGGTAGRRRRKTFSELIAETTRGVDGEGKNPGAPAGQQPQKLKVGDDPVSKDAKTFDHFVKAEGIDAEHGLVFGFGIVCTENGVDYFDVQEDNIPEKSMLKAAADFAATARPGNEMHTGPDSGQHVFLFPLTAEIAKALGITTKKTGLLLGYKPTPEVLAKFKSGEYTGFSIEGVRIKDLEV